jgi:hypothetical protein
MKNTLLVFLFLLAASLRVGAQQVVWDPATQDPSTLPAGMTIVNVDGTDYLQVVLDGWNSFFNVEPVVIADHYTHFNCMVKYSVGTSGYALNQINTFLKVSTPGGVEQAANGAASTASFAERSVALAVKDTIGIVQIAGQQTVSWGAVAGDTLWVGKITLVGGLDGLIPGMITRETFGTLVYDTGNPVTQPTGRADSWNWTDVTDFTSENGHIEGGSDSSIRINTYGSGYVVRNPMPDRSGGAHALIVNRGAYNGSWDTLTYLGIDLTGSVATSVEFAYAKNPNWYINNDTNVINVEYRLDGADWTQMDTSLIDTLYKGVWDHVALPLNYAEGLLDLRICGLNSNQVMIDDLSVYGLVTAPQGTNDFTVENVIVGSVADAADYTCNLTASWDADSMYMDFVIADDSVVGTGTVYQIDNLEIYFDMDNSKNIHWPRNGGWVSGDATYDANDFQLRLIADSAYTADNQIGGAKLIFALTDTGYNYTLNIAWDTLLAGFVGVDTAVIGFDVLASDNDAIPSDANRNQITLNSPTDKPFNDPSLFATFAFRADGRFEIMPDVEGPTRPENLVGVNDSATVTLTWDPSVDAMSAIMSYDVYQGATLLGNQIAAATGNRRVVNELAEGNYQFGVVALDNYGNASARNSIYVDVVYPGVGIQPDLTQEFNVYPNPATSVLNITAAGTIQNIQVISITGTIVMNITGVNQIDLSTLKAGLYMIKVSTNSDVYSTTFVRE